MDGKIQLKSVVKIYGPTPNQRPLKILEEGASKDEILAKTGHVLGLNDVTFNVQQGEIFVVMGLSGSGKSTLIRCVNRLIEPTAGSIKLDGEEVTTLDTEGLRELRRSKIAMVFQHFGLFPHKTVGYNAGYGLQVRGVEEDVWREKALEALGMVGLREWADYLPHNLSGGMQQRVGLARALATDADILLMDEAFSALDPLIRREMQDELLKLQEKLHKTILFITHDLGEALRVGNRVAVMRDGEVVQIGTPQQIITEPEDDYVAKFMADVDSGRVLTAEFIISPGMPVQLKKHTVKDVIERMTKKQTDYIFVVDKEERPIGIVHRKKVKELDAQGKTDFSRAVRAEHLQTSNNTHLNELYEMASQGEPIVVLDDDGKMQGVLYPLDIFNALAYSNEYEDIEADDVIDETIQSPELETVSANGTA